MQAATSVQVLASCGVTLGSGLLAAGLALPRMRPLDRLVVAIPISISLWWLASQLVVGPLVTRSWGLSLAVAALTAYTLVVLARMLIGLSRGSAVALGGLTVLALLVWWPLLRGALTVPTGLDSVSHSVYAARIAVTQTMEPFTVLSGELGRASGEQTYYPLGAHLAAVVSGQATGAGVAIGLQSLVILSGAVLLPCAMAAITRLLTRDDGAAWLAAGAAVVLPPLAVHKLTWGGIPTLLGMSCIAAVLLLGEQVCRNRRPTPGLLIGLALAVAGAVIVHTTQALTALLLTTGLVIALPSCSWARRTFAVATLVACAGVAVLVTGAWRAANSVESASLAHPFDGSVDLGEAVTRLLTVQNWAGQNGIPFALLAGLGVVTWYRHRLPPVWPVTLLSAVTAALAVTLIDLTPLRQLTSPWYSASWRLMDLIVVTATPIAAFGATAAARALRRQVRGSVAERADGVARPRRVLSAAPAVAAVLLLALVAGQSVSKARPAVALALEHRNPVSADQLGAFTFLSQHVGPGDRVLNAPGDGTGWMLALEGVEAVHMIHSERWVGDDFRTARRALRSVEQGRTDQDAVDDFRRLKVRYLITTGFSFTKYRDSALDGEAVENLDVYPLVYRNGEVRVFELPAHSW